MILYTIYVSLVCVLFGYINLQQFKDNIDNDKMSEFLHCFKTILNIVRINKRQPATVIQTFTQSFDLLRKPKRLWDNKKFNSL